MQRLLNLFYRAFAALAGGPKVSYSRTRPRSRAAALPGPTYIRERTRQQAERDYRNGAARFRADFLNPCVTDQQMIDRHAPERIAREYQHIGHVVRKSLQVGP